MVSVSNVRLLRRRGRRGRRVGSTVSEISLLDRIAPYRARIAVSVTATALLAILAATPQLLGSRLGRPQP